MGRHSMLLAAVAVFAGLVVRISECDAAVCTESITSVTGPYAPKGQICSGQLIFNEDFNKLDLRRWQHESTLAGGGVSFFKQILKLIKCFFRVYWLWSNGIST